MIYWKRVKKTNRKAVELYSRHYSSYKSGKSMSDWLNSGITPPGESTTLLLSDGDKAEECALFVWVKQKYRLDDQEGVMCSIFRNESEYLSSELIRMAEVKAWERWPGERLFTFVDADKVNSPNPGYCFKVAGWWSAGEAKNGQVILEKIPATLSPVTTGDADQGGSELL
jgi:hypothetical protein